MARIRSLKPEFFTDEDMAALHPLHRLAFEGLWCHADKAGRLEDRPARLKVQILPYDDVEFREVLDALVAARFVQRYVGPDGKPLLQIRTFEKHQRPRPDEPDSQLPEPPRLPPTDTAPALHSDATVTPQRLGKEGKGRGTEGKGAPPFGPEEVVALWNSIVTAPIPQVARLTADRRTKIAARLKTYPKREEWTTSITWYNGQAWCRAPGTGEHANWTVTLDWLVKGDGPIQRALEKAVRSTPRGPTQCPHDPPCPSGYVTYACQQRSTLGEERWRQLQVAAS